MGRRNRKSGKKMSKELRPRKQKVSILTTEGITYVDYKDVNLLRRFMSERAKIRARRVTGNSSQQQRQVARAIRVAREMALLPYQVRQVTQRGRKKRDREMRPTGAAPRPSTPPPPPPGVGASPDADEAGVPTPPSTEAAPTESVSAETAVSEAGTASSEETEAVGGGE
jgi:ribosomal protein S18